MFYLPSLSPLQGSLSLTDLNVLFFIKAVFSIIMTYQFFAAFVFVHGRRASLKTSLEMIAVKLGFLFIAFNIHCGLKTSHTPASAWDFQ